jgi:hypothetical protein
MPTVLKTKNSVTTTVSPTSLAQGELAVNITDKKMWVGNAATTPVQILGAGATNRAGGSNTQVQYNSSGDLAGSANMVFDGSTLTTLNTAYTGTLTGGTGVVNLGSGQFYKDASGNVGVGVTPSAWSSGVAAYQTISGYGLSQYGLSQNSYYNGGWKYISTGTALLYQHNTDFIWYAADSGTAGNSFSYTQVMSVNKGKTLALQGATIQTGTGITFPASQNASSDANTLDDYEEGQFSPTVGSGFSSVTYSTQTGQYVKIGALIYYECILVFSGTRTSSRFEVANLPFTSSSIDAQGGYWVYSGGNLSLTYLPSVYIPPNSSYFALYTTAGASVSGTDFNTGTNVTVRFAGCYRV